MIKANKIQMIHQLKILGLVLLLAFPLLVFGQSWTKVIGTAEDDDGRAVQVAPNGDIIVVGFIDQDGGTQDIIIQRYTSYGDLLQSVQHDHFNMDIHEDRAYNFLQRDNGNIVTIGQIKYNVGIDDLKVYITEYDEFGNFLWDADLNQQGVGEAGGIVEDPDGNGYIYSGTIDGKLQIGRILFGATDPVQVVEIPDALQAFEMKLTPENDLIVGGSVKRDVLGEDIFDPFVVKYSSDLNTEIDRWTVLDDVESKDISKIIVLSDGSYAICGTLCMDVDATPTCMAYVTKLSSDLQEQWTAVNDNAAGSMGTMGVAMVEDFNGDIMFTGRQDGKVFLTRFDAGTGFQYWSETYDVFGSTGIGCDISIDGHGFLIAGNVDNGVLGNQDAFLMRVTTDGAEATNSVSGFVWADFNNNCSADNLLLDDVVLEFYDDNQQYFTRPAEDGLYEISLPNGVFRVNIHSPSKVWEPSTCVQDLVITANGDLVLERNMYVTDVYECADLAVNITTPSLLPCESSTYILQYCNQGSIPTDNSVIELKMDEQLTLVGSSIPPATVSDDVVLFDVGSLNPSVCGEIEIEVILDCIADPLRTYIVSAKVQEEGYCIPGDVDWDGSDLEVEAVCLGDSVYITLKNEGLDMTEDLLYRIVEDNVIFSIFPVLLEQGEVYEITRPLNGSTVRVEMDQSIGHPADSAPSVTLEACVPQGQSTYSTGFVTDYPQNDSDLSVDIDCFEVSEQPEPFDEISYPSGVGDEHFIAANQAIEYKLYVAVNPETQYKRFEIRQKLSPHLDMSTFRLDLASSDDLAYKIVEDNVIFSIVEDNVIFSSALLIKYTVSPYRDLPGGTVITNTTTLYENYDLPIERTTDRFLTIADPLFDDSTLEKTILWDEFTVTTDNQHNYLTWTTRGEYNNDRFEIYHSVDGEEFIEFIDLPDDVSQSSGEMRSFTDTSPGQGLHCYRIDRYDTYGHKSSTEEVCVLIEARGNEITVNGANPFADLLPLTILTTGASTQAISVYQVDGKMVHQSAVELETGYNDVDLPLQDLPRGMYVVELTSLDETLFLKVMKE